MKEYPTPIALTGKLFTIDSSLRTSSRMAHYTLMAQGAKSPSEQYHERDSDDASDNYPFLEKNLQFLQQKPFIRRHFKSVILHSILCIVNVLLCLGVLKWAQKDCPFGVHGPNLVYSKFCA